LLEAVSAARIHPLQNYGRQIKTHSNEIVSETAWTPLHASML